jgi:hypothetical protein
MNYKDIEIVRGDYEGLSFVPSEYGEEIEVRIIQAPPNDHNSLILTLTDDDLHLLSSRLFALPSRRFR